MLAQPTTLLAGSITFFGNSSVASAVTDWSGTLIFPKFDGSLGTLTDVELEVAAPAQTQLTMSNVGSSASSGTIDSNIEVSVIDPDGYWAAENPMVDAELGPFQYSLASGAAITMSVYSTTASGSIADSGAQILSEFTGSGTISLNANTLTQTEVANTGGNFDLSQSTTAGLTGTITYFFTGSPAVVPAPAIIGSCGACLMIAAVRMTMCHYRRAHREEHLKYLDRS